jgi:hypothetical protein
MGDATSSSRKDRNAATTHPFQGSTTTILEAAKENIRPRTSK